ncbi:MAG: flagellar basal-body MS-ring/collar protein FliF [Pseudomonadota bacterium]
MSTWRALDARRRAILIGATLLSFLGLVAIGQLAARPGMALLYAGLDPAVSGEVVGALEAMGVAHEVRGDAIMVDESARDRARLALARDGLPRQGQVGYELLDEISGFSATSDMFNAAYWRAKEGELARTLLAVPRVRAARVHIAAPARRPFSRETAAPSASVTITTAGASLTAGEASAVRYLVALAVPGLLTEQVAVIDSRAGVILAPGEEDAAAAMADAGAAREERLRRAVEELLAARVGPGKARVSVSVALDRTGETVSEKRFDPDNRVVVHEDTEELSEQDEGADTAVTIASNLPDGEAAEPATRRSNRSETRARTNFDYAETRRERVRQPGAVARLSVAVLVDGISETAPDGTMRWSPRPQEELTALAALVRAAVGYDEARGDIVVVESMAFQPPPALGTAAEVSAVGRFFERNAMTLIQIGVLACVVLAILFTVIRPLLLRRGEELIPPYYDGADPALPEPEAFGEPGSALPAGDPMSFLEDALFHLPDRETLRAAVQQFPDNSVATLRDWLDQPEDEAA